MYQLNFFGAITYAELHLVCMLILFILARLTVVLNKKSTFKTEPAILMVYIFYAVVMFSDAAWVVLEGLAKASPRPIAYAANILWFVSSGFAAYSWFLFCEQHQKTRIGASKLYSLLCSIPALLLSAACIHSVWAHTVFYLDENGKYIRGPWYFIYVIVVYGYPILASLLAVMRFLRTRNQQLRIDNISMFVFPLPIILMGAFQSVFDVSGNCVGVVISLSIVFASVILRRFQIQAEEEAAAKAFSDLIVNQLSSAFSLNLLNHSVTVRHRGENFDVLFDTAYKYTENVQRYIQSNVHADERLALQKALTPAVIRERLKKEAQYAFVFRDISAPQTRWFRLQVIRGADELHAVIGFSDITESLLKDREQHALIESLSMDYESVFLVDAQTDTITDIRVSDRYSSLFRRSGDIASYSRRVLDGLNRNVVAEDKELVAREFSIDYALERFKDEPNYFCTYRSRTVSGREIYYRAKFVRLGETNITRFIIAFRNADVEVRTHFEQEAALAVKVSEQTREIREATQRIIRAQLQEVEALASLIESRDFSTGKHVYSTRLYYKFLVDALRKEDLFPELKDKDYAERIVNASVLHDVGKIFISDTILNKPGRLTDEEFEIIKTHTVHGKEIVDRIFADQIDPDMTKAIRDIAYLHHERWDGTGYPLGLKGEAIPLPARIMAVVDVFDALISKRPYKEAYSLDRAYEILAESAGKHFDPRLVNAFAALRPEVERYLSESESN